MNFKTMIQKLKELLKNEYFQQIIKAILIKIVIEILKIFLG